LGVAKRLFGSLEQNNVNVVLIAQASSEHSIAFATSEAQAALAKEVIEDEFSKELEQNRISSVDVKAPCSIIAAVGDHMSSTTGCSGRFFSALGDAKINVIAIAQGCNERNISAVVPSQESVRALRAVHAAFRLSHTTIRIGIVGANEIGFALLNLLDAQRGVIRASFDLDLQVCVVADGEDKGIVCLKKDDDSCSDSITLGAYKKAVGRNIHASGAERSTKFLDEYDTATIGTGGVEEILRHLYNDTCNNHLIFDCTNDESVGTHHADWLSARVDVVTANNTGLSGSKKQRRAISEAERAHGKQSAKYLREVTVGGGLPILKTLRSLLDSGDKIRRVDGIFSVSMSYIMFRISPPSDFAAGTEFDVQSSRGAFKGDLSLASGAKVSDACSFSEAVKEAISLGLMEQDPTKDFNNEYTIRVVMVLAKELGLADDIDVSDIQKLSDKLVDDIQDGSIDYQNLPSDIDKLVKERVDTAKSRGCVLRQISAVDVPSDTIDVKIVEVPERHVFAVTPPSCNCVRFFTHRHEYYPLIVQGPSAGSESTASALLAELLHLMKGKSTPKSVPLRRTISGAVLLS
jgi:bifunctional aspartokinase / homoserine dehydrogenase 1